ncbi:TetR/AcrR family transcriptional regulator [Robertkochia aurantiaca]|uniref:TetR/AcrR family transcriptional regulator n=1 Tax=Robertkochia aurantiaca TaxID=2873700 RepID=UPI001CD0166C|nr:TetR/AcrR family transcriptional regulator [Robertkochia sp. 3YJGBD-33]
MKNAILDKSAEMFLSYGFKSVTMDDIASEMGISKKTIYQHYNNKTKLVEASVFHIYESICDGIQAIHDTAENPIEELYNFKRYIMRHLKNERSSPHYQLKKYYPRIYDELMWKQFQLMLKNVSENLQKGIEMGIYRSTLDVGFVTRLYFKGISGIKDEDVFPPESFSMDYLQESFLEYHLRAITTEKGLKVLDAIMNEHKSVTKE